MSLKILNVNDMLDLNSGGGTAERTFQMSRSLAQEGAHCKVLTVDSDQLDAHRIEALKPAKAFVLPCLLRRFKVPRWNWKLILGAVKDADIVHLMGHWSLLNALTYIAARRLGKPYVVCPAGALPLFGRSKLLKHFFNLIVGNAIIRNASGWIAVTESEYPQFEQYGVPVSRVTVIPNGVSEEDFPVTDVAEFRQRHELPDVPIILFMGRLNPIKGPDLLLRAFIKSRHKLPSHHLVFVGPDGGMLASLRETVQQQGMNEIVHFLGYVGGADKSSAYRMASLLVIPSRQEAMSIVAIEAGICGVPVLLTDQCGLSEIRSIDARLEVNASVDGIANGLASLLTGSENLEKVALAWHSFVARNYAWTSLTKEYFRLYENILAAKSR
jgi:glycosyltransferase involved in cell wall biosynthesis